MRRTCAKRHRLERAALGHCRDGGLGLGPGVDACAVLAKPFELQVLLDAVQACAQTGLPAATA